MNLFSRLPQVNTKLPKANALLWICLSLAAAIALSILIWLYGDRIGSGDFRPLASPSNRLIMISITGAVWLFTVLLSARRRKKDQPENTQNELNAEPADGVSSIFTQLRLTFRTIREISRKRQSHISRLPCYLIVGSENSGKTSALRSSGFHPIITTRHSKRTDRPEIFEPQWWHAEDAILIEATTPRGLDKASPEDANSIWGEFLRLLKKFRNTQPLSGVIVSISISEFLDAQSGDTAAFAEDIRQRLNEIDRIFKTRVPIYVVLTKADLLTGFESFFSGFPVSERDQVWGITFPAAQAAISPNRLPGLFGREFMLLQQRIDGFLLERLQQETDGFVRGKIFRFMVDFSKLKEPVEALLTKLCCGSANNSNPFLRGIYLTSAVPSDADSVRPRPEGRSYFFKPLLQTLIFKEAALVMRDKFLTRRRTYFRLGLIATTCLLTGIVITGLMTNFTRTNVAIDKAQTQLSAYEQLSSDIPVRNVSDADFLRILPGLDSLQDMADTFKQGFSLANFEVFQKNNLGELQTATYGNALNQTLLPRLMVYLQNELDAKQDLNSRFNTLKLYSMLGGLGPLDKSFALVQGKRIFDQLYPGESRGAIRLRLERHTENLLASELAPINIDQRRITKARNQIKSISVAERAFDILLAQGDAQNLPPWQPVNVLGPVAIKAFDSKSGRSLQSGVAGIYTSTGYSNVVRKSLTRSAESALNEYWVRGEEVSSAPLPTLETLSKSVIEQYFHAFTTNWDTILNDIKIRTPTTLFEASDTARLLAASPTPLEKLAKSILGATKLTGDIIPENGPALTIEVPDSYPGLRRAVEPPMATEDQDKNAQATAKTVFSTLQPQLQALSDQFALFSTSSAEVSQIFGAESELNKANSALVREARTLPRPLNVWLAGMTTDNIGFAIGAARESISKAWQANGAQLCGSLADGRYPFDRNAQSEITMTDFIRLFSPEGLFQSFFDQQLKPFVDTTTTPWGWRGTSEKQPLTSQALQQFENADKISHAFFPSGGNIPAIRIDMTPLTLSETANAVILELEGQRAVYFHGPKLAKSVIWPSQNNMRFSRIIFQPGGWQDAQTINGDWSPFRLLDQATITDEAPDRFKAHFANKNYAADFDIKFGSIMNPLRLRALNEFRCPFSF